MKIRYWGTRGSLSAPTKETTEVGANTLCIELRTKDNHAIIMDAGFGIIGLGNDLVQKININTPNVFHIFFTHFHWDHIQGLQYFKPIYYKTSTLKLYSPHPVSQLKRAIEDSFARGYSPFESLYNLPSTIEFKKLSKKPLRLFNTEIRNIPVDHTTPTYSYRIEQDGLSIVYATDHEAKDPKINKPFLNFAKGADILIHDAMFFEKEYNDCIGWGHSTIEKALQNGLNVKAKQIHLFHHGVSRADTELKQYVDTLINSKREELKDTKVLIAKDNDSYSL